MGRNRNDVWRWMSSRSAVSRVIRAALVAGIAALLALPFPPGALAAPITEPECRYVAAAPRGAAGNYLLIERGESIGLRRVGEELGVFKLHGRGRQVECEGRAATVRDVEKVLFRPPGGGHQLTIEESGGPFGGVEIYARFPKAHPNLEHLLSQPAVTLVGTEGPDTMRVGRIGRDRSGIALGEGDGARPEVIVSSRSPARLTLVGEGGADRLDSSGAAPEFDGPPPVGRVFLDGGPGDDTILGGPRRDIVRAGPGDDLIETAGGDDVIEPGTGIDHVYGGPGDDLIQGEGEEGGFDLYSGGPGDDSIQAADDERERILCGPGFDHVGVDVLDEWQSPECERAHGPGALTGG